MLPALHRPGLALALVVAQLFAAAHLALVPHTSSASGRVAEQSFSIEEHVDAVAHQGPHAHLPGTDGTPRGEEQCTLVCLLSSSLAPKRDSSHWLTLALAPAPVAPAPVSAEPSRRERLLAAPKASPPSA